MAAKPGKRDPFEFDAIDRTDDDSFLGTLSILEGDAPTLGEGFSEVYARFVSLREAYLAGHIDAHSFGTQIRNLRVLDEDGIYWTLGATTMRWYAFNPHNATQWIASPLTAQRGDVVDADGRASGWAVENWQERRAQRAAEHAKHPTNGPDTGQSARSAARELPTASDRRRLSIDEMFERYVYEDDASQHYAIEASVLSVDDAQPSE